MSAACVYWCDVVDLCAGCAVAYGACGLVAKYVPPVFEVFGVFVCSAHNALPPSLRFGCLRLWLVVFVDMFKFVAVFDVTTLGRL